MSNHHQDLFSIENLLEEARFSPTPVFSQALHDHLAQQLNQPVPDLSAAAHQPVLSTPNVRRPSTRQWAFSGVLVLGLVLVLLVTLVPAVQAQVIAMLQQFGVPVPFASQGMVISPFTPLAPEKIPDQMRYFASLNLENSGVTYIELRYFSQNDFIVLYETAAQPGENLPQGETVQIGSQTAMIVSDLNGMVFLAAQSPQPWRLAGNGGGGGNSDDAAAPPQMLNYSSATQLTWIQSGLHLEMLTNLPRAEALRLASSFVPAPQLKK
jgi:hypothetical protein